MADCSLCEIGQKENVLSASLFLCVFHTLHWTHRTGILLNYTGLLQVTSVW